MSEPVKHHVSWQDVERLVGQLLPKLTGGYDAILVITRGGLVPACLISERTGIRNILCAAVMLYDDTEMTLPEPVFVQFPADELVAGRRLLVVDDVWDSGKTIVAVRERLRKAGARAEVCVLHYKPAHSRFPSDGPEYYGEEISGWVVYPWDPGRVIDQPQR
jgi:hypoxanthine phosphoribosyltransferase